MIWFIFFIDTPELRLLKSSKRLVQRQNNDSYLQNQCTPADEIVILHMMILAEVDSNYFAPEQQPFDQHPTKGCHEEEMEQRSNKCARHLQNNYEKITDKLMRANFWFYFICQRFVATYKIFAKKTISKTGLRNTVKLITVCQL